MKKHINKLLSLILASVMLLGAFACAAPKENDNTEENGKTPEPDNEIHQTGENVAGRAIKLSAGYTPGTVRDANADAEFVKSQADFAVELLKNSLSGEKSTLVRRSQ